MRLYYQAKEHEIEIWNGLKDGSIGGQPKIVLKVNSLEDLEKINKLGQFNNLPTAIVRDAGLTQLEAGTATCVGIGPAPDYLIDKITGGLKLL